LLIGSLAQFAMQCDKLEVEKEKEEKEKGEDGKGNLKWPEERGANSVLRTSENRGTSSVGHRMLGKHPSSWSHLARPKSTSAHSCPVVWCFFSFFWQKKKFR